MNKTLIIIPTYNESQNIEKLINELRIIESDILIVDDSSPDNTSDIVKKDKEFNNSIFVIDRPNKLGLGSAYREGFSWAIKNNYSYIAQMDADFSHRVVDLIKLLEHKKDFGLTLGSRYISGGETDGWNKRRKILSKYANIVSTFVTSSHIKDMTSGFRVYSKNALIEIDYMSTKTDGYSFQIEMLVRALDKKIDIIEVPIIFDDRKDGDSKFDSNIVIEAIITLFRLLVRKKNN
tara:strand:- start:1705 stop:2409 length:705 start_codon:yes stop_codon:yes gene_type:complete